ncbi:MAG: DUF4920 domain-containing protein [Flavobacterium sp.]|nr:DUF4920 domain-containing protein [Flavobacterium sp.]
MKKIIMLICLSISIASCKGQSKTDLSLGNYESFGNKITDENAISKEEISSKYENLKLGDTINVKFKSKINSVCQNKGCWMKLELADKKETFVKFKDYAFFMPKDSKNKEVIVNGKAFVSEESVADQKHYAGDAGKPQSEIDKITTIKKTLSFTADGVLIKK